MANWGTSGPDSQLPNNLGVNDGVPNGPASISGDPGSNWQASEGRTSRRPSTLGTAPELALGDFKALNKQPVPTIDIPSPPPLRRRSEVGSAPSAETPASPVASSSSPSRGRGCKPPKDGKFSFRSPCFGGSAASKSQGAVSLDQRAKIAQFPPASRKLSSGTIQILAQISGSSRTEKKGDSSRRESLSAAPAAAVGNSDELPPEVAAPPPSESEFTPSIPSGPPSEPEADVAEALPPLQAEEAPPSLPDQPPLEFGPSQCRCSISNPPNETEANTGGVSLGDPNSMNRTSDNDPGNSSGQNALNAALLNAQAPDIIELVKRADLSREQQQQPRQAQAGGSPIRGLRPNPRQNARGRPPLRQGRYVPDSSAMARTAGGGQPGPGRPPGGVRLNRQQLVGPPPQNVRGYAYNNLQNLPNYENQVPSPPTNDSGVARLFDAIIGRGEHLDQYERQEQEDQQSGAGNRYGNMILQIGPEPAHYVPSPPKTNAGVTRLVDAILGRGEHLEQYDWQQQQQEENVRARPSPSPSGTFIQRQQFPLQVRQYQPNAIPGRSPTASAGTPSSSRTPGFRGNRTRGYFSEPSNRDSGPGSGSGSGSGSGAGAGSGSGPGPSTGSGSGSGPGSGSVPNEAEAGMDPEYGSDQDMDITSGQSFPGQTSERAATGAGVGVGAQDMEMSHLSPEPSGESQDMSTSEEIDSGHPDELTWKRKIMNKEAKGRRGAKVDFDYHRRRGYPDTTFNPRPGDIIIRARKRSGLRLTDFFYYDNENYLEQGDQILRAKFEYLPPMDTMYLWCRLYVYGADGTYTYLDSTSEIVEKFRIDADVTTFKNTARFT